MNRKLPDVVGRGLLGFPGSEILAVTPGTDYLIRKDFEVIAGAIRINLAEYHRTSAQAVAVTALANDLACELRHTNPRFDPDRFLTACGVK